MVGKRISRNDPCPCGSGKKFKHCCINKGIDWQARAAISASRSVPAPRPKTAPPAGFFLGAFGGVDAKLKKIAEGVPAGSAWKGLVESLTGASPIEQRVAAYRAIREAGVLPDDAAGFLFVHAAQWVLPERTDEPEEEEEGEDERDDLLDRHTVAMLRRCGADDLADLYATNQQEYERRRERGRQFFFGPPDEKLAERLRELGIID